MGKALELFPFDFLGTTVHCVILAVALGFIVYVSNLS